MAAAKEKHSQLKDSILFFTTKAVAMWLYYSNVAEIQMTVKDLKGGADRGFKIHFISTGSVITSPRFGCLHVLYSTIREMPIFQRQGCR